MMWPSSDRGRPPLTIDRRAPRPPLQLRRRGHPTGRWDATSGPLYAVPVGGRNSARKAVGVTPISRRKTTASCLPPVKPLSRATSAMPSSVVASNSLARRRCARQISSAGECPSASRNDRSSARLGRFALQQHGQLGRGHETDLLGRHARQRRMSQQAVGFVIVRPNHSDFFRHRTTQFVAGLQQLPGPDVVAGRIFFGDSSREFPSGTFLLVVAS